MVRRGAGRRGAEPYTRPRRQAHERGTTVRRFDRHGGRRVPRDGRPLARERGRHLRRPVSCHGRRGRLVGARRGRRRGGVPPARGYVLGRPFRTDRRPLRSPLGARPARARGPARGGRARRRRGVRRLGVGKETGAPDRPWGDPPPPVGSRGRKAVLFHGPRRPARFPLRAGLRVVAAQVSSDPEEARASALSPIARSSLSPSSRSGPALVASATSSGSPMPTFALTFPTSSPTANSTVASAPWRLN